MRTQDFVERPDHGQPGVEGPPGRWQQRVPGPQLPGMVSGVTLLLGIWLVIAPFLWTYGDTGGGFDARWNDALVGLAIAAVGLARLARPIRLVTATALGTLLGGWLIIAPLLLGYGFGADSTWATVNDVVVGMIVAGLAMLGYGSARNAVTRNAVTRNAVTRNAVSGAGADRAPGHRRRWPSSGAATGGG